MTLSYMSLVVAILLVLLLLGRIERNKKAPHPQGFPGDGN